MLILVACLTWFPGCTICRDDVAVLNSIEVRSAYNRKLLANHVYDYTVSYRTGRDLSNLLAADNAPHNMVCKFVDAESCLLFSCKYLEEQKQIDLAKKNKETLQMPFSSSYIIINKITGDTARSGHLFNDISLFPGRHLMNYTYTPYDMAIYGDNNRGTIQDLIERSRKGEVAITGISTENEIVKLTTTETTSGVTEVRQWELAADKAYSPTKLISIISREGKEQSRRTVQFEDYRQETGGLWFPRMIVRYHRRLDGLWGIDLTKYSKVDAPGPNACSLITLALTPGRVIYLGDVPFSSIHPDTPTEINVDNLHDYITQCQAIAEASTWARRGFFDKYRYYLLAILLVLAASIGWLIYQRKTKTVTQLKPS